MLSWIVGGVLALVDGYATMTLYLRAHVDLFQIGSLALELLRDCRENKEVFRRDAKQAKYSTRIRIVMQALILLQASLGEAIVHGDNELLRLIAGSVVREMIHDSLSGSEFWPTDMPSSAFRGFPANGELTSQWAVDFTKYVDDLDSQAISTAP